MRRAMLSLLRLAGASTVERPAVDKFSVKTEDLR